MTSPSAPSTMTGHAGPHSQLLRDTDRCVKCAICLPHCPTYALDRDESESPRGRITLMQGLLTGQLECTDQVTNSLNNCLNCGRCEKACPAQVPFTRIIDGVRTEFSSELKRTSLIRHARLLNSGWKLAILAKLNRFAAAIRLAKWPAIPARWRKMLRFVGQPPTQLNRASTEVSPKPQAPSLVMMAGCINNAFEPDVAASLEVLASIANVRLEQPSAAQCCGALSLHAGDQQAARRSAESLIAAYKNFSAPLVVLPTGCQRGVQDVLEAAETPGARTLLERVTDLYSLLYAALATQDVFRSTTDKIEIHVPCTQSKASSDALLKLLALVPDAQINVLHSPYGCCGAAGNHMLTSPVKAAQFAAPLVTTVTEKKPDYVLTANTGCAWHLRAELSTSSPNTPVWHPLQWLARALHNESASDGKLET